MADQEEKKKSKKKDKELGKKTSQSTWSWSSIRRSLLVSVGTSSMGKGAIMNNLPYETQNLIKSLVTLTGVVRGEEAATALESNIFRLLCELFSAHSAKEISYKDFLIADPCLREAFEVLMKLLHYYENNPHNINLKPGFKRAQELLTIASELMTAVIEERLHWQGEMLGRLGLIVREAGNADFLIAVWEEPDLGDTLFDLHDAMQKYNAFHYYSKSTGMRSEPSLELEQRLSILLTRSNSVIKQKVVVGPGAASSSSPGMSSSAPP